MPTDKPGAETANTKKVDGPASAATSTITSEPPPSATTNPQPSQQEQQKTQELLRQQQQERSDHIKQQADERAERQKEEKKQMEQRNKILEAENSKKKLETLLSKFNEYNSLEISSPNLPTKETVTQEKSKLLEALYEYSNLSGDEFGAHDNADTAFIRICRNKIDDTAANILFKIERAEINANNKKTAAVGQTTPTPAATDVKVAAPAKEPEATPTITVENPTSVTTNQQSTTENPLQEPSDAEKLTTASAIAQPESNPTQTTNQQQQNEKRALTYTERQKYRGIIAKSMNELFDVKTVSKFGEPQEFLLDKKKIEEKYQDLKQSFSLDAEGKPKTEGLSPEDKLLVETAYNRMERVYATLTSLQKQDALETTVPAQKFSHVHAAETNRSRLELMLVKTDADALFDGKSFSSKDEIEKIYQDKKELIKIYADELRPAHENDAQLVKDVESKILRAKHEAFKPTLTTSQKIETKTTQQIPPEKEPTPNKPIQFTIKEYPPTSEPKQTAKENAATTPDKLATTTAGATNPTPIQEETAPKVDSSRQKKSPTEVYDERYKKNGTYTEGHSSPTADLATRQTALELTGEVDCEQYLQAYVTANPGVKFDIIADKKEHHFDPIDILDEDKREDINEWIRQDIGNSLGIQPQPEEPGFWETILDKLCEWMRSSPKKDDPTPLSQSTMSELPNTCKKPNPTNQYKAAVGSLNQNHKPAESHTVDEPQPKPGSS